MNWIDVNDRLPEDGQAVLVRRNQDNWLCKHTINGVEQRIWRWQACRFVRGLTNAEAAARGYLRSEDQHGNNLVPYCWQEFGPGTLFGQDVSHWAAITDPVTPSQFSAEEKT